jgi:hypothetical protein
MLRTICCAILALALFVGAALAAEGVITKVERGKITVKVGDKEQEIMLSKDIKILGADGNEIPGKERRNALKKDAKVEITEKDGKVVEIKVK